MPLFHQTASLMHCQVHLSHTQLAWSNHSFCASDSAVILVELGAVCFQFVFNMRATLRVSETPAVSPQGVPYSPCSQDPLSQYVIGPFSPLNSRWSSKCKLGTCFCSKGYCAEGPGSYSLAPNGAKWRRWVCSRVAPRKSTKKQPKARSQCKLRTCALGARPPPYVADSLVRLACS